MELLTTNFLCCTYWYWHNSQAGGPDLRRLETSNHFCLGRKSFSLHKCFVYVVFGIPPYQKTIVMNVSNGAQTATGRNQLIVGLHRRQLTDSARGHRVRRTGSRHAACVGAGRID